MPRQRENLRSIPHPNATKLGQMPYFKPGIGNELTAVGTSGQVLIYGSDGTPAPGTLTAVASIKRTAYTASGTHTVDTNCLFALVMGCGAGGGGGGARPDGLIAGIAGGGGGGGQSVREWFTVADLGGAGASITVTINAAGAAGANNGGNGGNGGTSTFGTLITCDGGLGGTGSGNGASALAFLAGGRGGGGTSTTGDENQYGGDGEYSRYNITQTIAIGGNGGGSAFGRGGTGGSTDAAGGTGTGRGAGGGGAADDDNTGQAGGVGTAGTFIVIEFLKS